MRRDGRGARKLNGQMDPTPGRLGRYICIWLRLSIASGASQRHRRGLFTPHFPRRLVSRAVPLGPRIETVTRSFQFGAEPGQFFGGGIRFRME